jgi:hypothetical protein
MSRKVLIDSRFWNDPWVVDTLSAQEKAVFLYLITNAYGNLSGVYEISFRTISNDTGYERDELLKMFERFKPKIVYMNGWVVLRNGIKNQNYHSPKIQAHIINALSVCPVELLEYINWPHDYHAEKPEGTKQQRLLVDDINDFDDSGRKARGNSAKTDSKNVVIDDNTPLSNLTTLQSEKYSIGTVSHSNSNSNTKPVVPSVPDVSSVENSKTTEGTIGTTGKEKTEGKSYAETNLLYNDLKYLANDKFRSWYCKVFFKIGRQRVLILASQAKVDGNDPIKLFAHLLQKESGERTPI